MRSAGVVPAAPIASGYSVELGAAGDTGITVTDAALEISDNFTLEFWFRPEVLTGENTPVQKGDEGSGANIEGFRFNIQPTVVIFRGQGPSNEVHFRQEFLTVNTHEWVHWAGTRDSTTGGMRIFRNGIELGTEQISNAGIGYRTDQNTALSFGRQPIFGGQPVEQGRLYEVRLWTEVRTPAEILANYNKALVGDEANLLAYYKFESDYTDSGPNGFDMAVTTGAATFELDTPLPHPFAALGSELWDIPDSPHTLDDEFESGTLDPAWDTSSVPDLITAIDPYDNAVGTARVNVHGTHPSWLMTQGPINFSKAYPGGLPLNCLIWARMRWSRDLTEANGESEIALWFGGSAGGVYDNANQIGVYMSEWTSGEYAEGYQRNGGLFPRWGNGSTAMTNEGTAIEYVAVQKIGATFHVWVIGNAGNRFYLGSSAFTGGGTLDRVGFTMTGTLNTPGGIIAGIDFFRVVETDVLVP